MLTIGKKLHLYVRLLHEQTVVLKQLHACSPISKKVRNKKIPMRILLFIEIETIVAILSTFNNYFFCQDSKL